MNFRYYILNKPYGMVSQFSGESKDELLGSVYNFPSDIYPVGRLDKDSEGMLLLTNDNIFKSAILEPNAHTSKTYLAQVEGIPDTNQLELLESGNLTINHKGRSHSTARSKCNRIDPPALWERNPPIRYRLNKPTSWIELIITEGKNRQVRKMTAAVGLPTLRLVRTKIGQLELGNLKPGQVAEIDFRTAQKALM